MEGSQAVAEGFSRAPRTPFRRHKNTIDTYPRQDERLAGGDYVETVKLS